MSKGHIEVGEGAEEGQVCSEKQEAKNLKVETLMGYRKVG